MTRPRRLPAIRRSLLALVALSTVIAVSACVPDTPKPAPTAASTAPCEGSAGVGGTVPDGLGPGDIVSAVDLTPANSTSPGFPTGGRVWRILYVTTGVDETDLQLVCGTVAAPAAGPKVEGSTGRLLNWAHGTVGIDQDCMPSNDPNLELWGPMPGGINAIAWGSDLGKHEGDAADGLLQYAINQGMVVSAADYQPGSTYVVGKMEASAVLDAARAATQLMTTTFSGSAPTSYDAVIWGHSQGGHAALWAGQLAETYLAATTPSQPTADITLVGVAALAPAGNFVTQPGQAGVQPGDGLADWEMHKNVGLDLPDKKLQMQIGPALFSYIFGSWDALAGGRAPAADAKFPAFPVNAASLDLSAIVTTDPGASTVSTVKALCLKADQAKEVRADVEIYEDASTNQMLVPSIWNLPENYVEGEYFRGGLDATCAGGADASIAAWCEWMLWNLPGPLASNPYPKAPIVDGNPVPLFIAQGINDDVIHCQPSAETPGGEVPAEADCMSRALYESFASEIYCPAGSAVAHLELRGVAQVGLEGIVSPATHLSIPGEISARAITEAADDLVFEGSPLQKFIASAFDGSAEPGCSQSLLG